MFRFAPSPSGDMHIKELRIALFNYITATQRGEKLHIRIEDVDQEQHLLGKEQEALDILSLFGIAYTEVSYQSHNLKFHQQLATKLLMDKNAFSCFCTLETLESKANQGKTSQYDDTCRYLSDEAVLNDERPFTIRIKRPDEDIHIKDTIQGELTFSKEEIDSFLILYADKTATYDFATAIDDMLSDISMIIVEEEKLPHAPKQILIRNYLGYDKEIGYAHVPALIDEKNTSIKWLLEEGFLPSAIINYLIMIGNDTPNEIFNLEEAIAWFDLSKISKSPVTFDINTLRQINRAHIKKMPALELAKFIGYSSKDLGELAKIYTEEGSTINEIKPKIDAIFAKKEPSKFVEEIQTLAEVAKKAPFFRSFEDFKSYLAKESELKEETLLKPLRFLLTGAEDGPDLGAIYPHIKNYLGEIIK